MIKTIVEILYLFNFRKFLDEVCRIYLRDMAIKNDDLLKSTYRTSFTQKINEECIDWEATLTLKRVDNLENKES